MLTHWPQDIMATVLQATFSNLFSCSGNGLAPNTLHTSYCTTQCWNAIGPTKTDFSWVWIKIQAVFVKDICWKISSVKRWQSCLDLNISILYWYLKKYDGSHINSFAPGRYGSNFINILLKFIMQNSNLETVWEIALRWILQDVTDD